MYFSLSSFVIVLVESAIAKTKVAREIYHCDIPLNKRQAVYNLVMYACGTRMSGSLVHNITLQLSAILQQL